MKLPKTADELDGTIKSAILLLLLNSDAAGKLLKELPTEAVEEVTRARGWVVFRQRRALEPAR
jgi:flagellar motor switch protein FliG